MVGKRANTYIETIVVMLLMSITMIIIMQGNSILMKSYNMVSEVNDDVIAYDNIAQILIREIKSSGNTFQLSETELRSYKRDGTYTSISYRGKSLYVNDTRMARVTSCKFEDLGDSIRAVITIKGSPKLELVIYKSKVIM